MDNFNFSTINANELLSKVVKNISSSTNRYDKLDAFKTIRKIIYEDQEGSPIDRIINFGIIPILIEYLCDLNQDKEIQYQCAWTLQCISNSDIYQHTQCLIDNEIHLVIIDLLSIHVDNLYLASRLLSILGNMVNTSVEFRLILVKEGIISILQYITLQNIDDPSIDEIISWSIYNITEEIGVELQSFLCEYKESIIQIVKSFILKYSDGGYDEVIVNSTRTISNLLINPLQSSGNVNKGLLVKYGITESIIKMTRSTNSDSIKIYGLRAIENMLNLCENNQDCYFQLIIDSDLVHTICNILNYRNLLNVYNLELIKDLFCVISKINYGQILMDSGILLKSIQIGISGILNFEVTDIVDEIKFKNITIILQSLDNAINNNNNNQIIYLLENKVVQFLQVNIEMVKLDQQLLELYLNTITNMLNKIKTIINDSTPVTNATNIIFLYNKTIRSSFIQSIQFHKTDTFDKGFDEIIILLNSINNILK